jgi:2',3'-cyclic-nucleotide 2'-phosphodiesterase (5'-nucleotidase family)
MTNNKQYRVESGEERWDYDSDVPTREVTSYWVMLGKEKIKSFSYYQQAIDYKNKLNNAVNSIKI